MGYVGTKNSLYGRLTNRYERRADIHLTSPHLGCSLIYLNYPKSRS